MTTMAFVPNVSMADRLGSIGIRKPAHEIKCMDEEDEPIKVKIFGNGEFEQKLASFISSDDTLSLVNTMCEIYQNLPYLFLTMLALASKIHLMHIKWQNGGGDSTSASGCPYDNSCVEMFLATLKKALTFRRKYAIIRCEDGSVPLHGTFL